ncbi:MAG: PEP-CTERM sorting domain-containing protein [Bythopirellula sp.]|nr:PEP-CTERM sorting domain-containing protein [Bythopirellula sp.]
MAGMQSVGESPTPFSSADLSDWQGNYGFGSLSAVTAVPEPSSLLLVMLLCGTLVARRP